MQRKVGALARHPRASLFIFGTALFLRLVIAAPCLGSLDDVLDHDGNYSGYSPCYTDDSPRYERLAINLLETGRYQASALPPFSGGLPSGDPPEVYRTPLYPAFLAGIYAITGYQSAWAIVVQILLSSYTAVLVWRLTRTLTGEFEAFAAGLAIALFPRSALHSAQIMSETLFVFLITLTFLLLTNFIERPNRNNALLLGITMAAGAYTRQVALYLPLLFLPVWILFLTRRRSEWRAILPHLILLFLAFYGSIGLWYLRTHRAVGQWYFSTLNDFNSAFFLAPWILEQREGITEAQALKEFSRLLCLDYPELETYCAEIEADPEFRWTLVENVYVNVRAGKVARELMLNEWRITLKSFVGGGFWSLWAGGGEWRGIVIRAENYEQLIAAAKEAKTSLYSGRLLAAISLITDRILPSLPWTFLLLFSWVWLLSLSFYIFSVPGAFRLTRQHPEITIAMGLLILFLAIVAGPAGNNRQFVAAYPLLAVLAASMLAGLSENKTGERLTPGAAG